MPPWINESLYRVISPHFFVTARAEEFLKNYFAMDEIKAIRTAMASFGNNFSEREIFVFIVKSFLKYVNNNLDTSSQMSDEEWETIKPMFRFNDYEPNGYLCLSSVFEILIHIYEPAELQTDSE